MTLNFVPEHVQQKLFGTKYPRMPKYVTQTLKDSNITDNTQWRENEILSIEDEPQGDVKDWFDQVSDDLAGRFKKHITRLLENIPDDFPPETPQLRNTWMHWVDGCWQEVTVKDLPVVMVLDAETVKDRGIWYPVTMVAWTCRGWYCWLADAAKFGEERYRTVPFPNNRLVTGWNISYDRQFLSSEYSRQDTGNRFLDGMSLLTSKNGLNRQQHPAFLKFQKYSGGTPRWYNHATEVGLDKAYRFFFGRSLSKGVRDEIIKSGWADWNGFVDKIVKYCGSDVIATWWCLSKLYYVLDKNFVGHNATWVGMLEVCSCYLPLDRDWYGYQQRAEKAYDDSTQHIKDLIETYAQEIVFRGEENSPIPGLDWKTTQRGKYKDYVKWYKELCQADFPIGGKLAPRILRLQWKGLDIYPIDNGKSKTWTTKDEMLPHPQGIGKNLSTPLIPDYLYYVNQGLLTTDLDIDLKDLFERLDSLTNWRAMQSRVEKVNVMKNDKGDLCTIPQISPMGTQSRRAADNTWLVAPNAKPQKIGSEIKAMVAAPEGYSIQGADIDSEESWLASVLGDKIFKYPGSNIWALSVLVGDKKKKTSIHCLTAEMTGLPRNIAKNLNFALLYGTGVKKAANMIQAELPEKTRQECENLASSMISSVKGSKIAVKSQEIEKRAIKQTYGGGIGSNVYNILDDFSDRKDVRTPILGYKIPDSLNPRNVEGDFKTTRVNWLIQSAGVDFLHLLLTGIKFYVRKLKLDVKLVIPTHDEVRFLVNNDHIDTFYKVLQTVHIKAKAYTYYVNEIPTMPQAVAWFSEVDVDDRLRKSVDDLCATPSTPEGFPQTGYTI